MAFITPTPTALLQSKRSILGATCNVNATKSTTFIRPFQRVSSINPLTNNVRQPSRTSQTPSMLVIEVGSTSEMDTILENAESSLVVIDYSTSWCGPCKIFAPIFEELSESYTDVVFVKVMGDASPDSSELMRRESIRAVPAFHFWKQKKRIKDITGARKDDVEKAITAYRDAKIETETAEL